MEQLLETAITLIAIAVAVAWLANRFLFKEKRGCGGATPCKCPKPVLPSHIKKGDSS